MLENWTKIYSSFDLMQVKIAEDVLKEYSIESHILNKPDSVMPTIGDAELFVLNENAERALAVLRERDIL
jgi:hypothetical protein